LAPGATQDVVVSFNPTSTGAKSATLSIESNDPDENPFDVPLSGNGIGIPDIAVSPTSHNYGDVLVGSSASQTFVVSNEGTADLVVSASTLTGANPGEFSITAGGAPFTLAPGATQDVVVSFNPASAGVKSATLSIESNDPDENPFDVPLSGNGIGIPDIAVSPTSHDYGDVLVGSSASQTFVVSNEGTADLVVSATTLTGTNPGEFSITAGGAPFTLSPGATQDVVVSFNPTSTGAKSATLSIESNDPDENPFDVPLSGNGAPVPAPDIAVNPTSHDYGDVLVGSSASQTFVVSNEGTADLVVSAATLSGANPGEFSIVSGGAPFTLAPGATQDVVVSFNPTSTGPKSATLSIASNDSDENPFDVLLSGNGIAAPSVLGYVDCPASAPQNCPFTIEIKVDMAGAAPPNHLLGSFTATLSWNPAFLNYTGNSGLLSGFSGMIDDANANNGIITFTGDNSGGVGGLVDLLNVDFEAIGASGSAATLDLEFSAMAAAQTSLNLLPFLTVNDCSVSITESALLGDVNGDNQVNSTDALVILSYDAGIPIPQPFLDRINAGLGDVNFDALTNSTDALIVLSYDAGIPVPFPLGDPLCPPILASPEGREMEN
ncbi:MAG: choice-of-anchor D domain-containing protein, partial [Calditrichia bacterium]|nr:choice-of-anchor D domain-containing protein [Calditrichia bacterium]